MDENVIFSKPTAAAPPSDVPPQPSSPVVPPVVSSPSPQPQIRYQQPTAATGAGNDSIAPPPPDSDLPKPPEASSKGQILKYVGIGLGVLVFLLLIIFIIIPRFQSKPKAEPVTLTYWGLFEEKGVMQTILDDFKRQNPNITVNYIQKDIKEYRKSLVTQIENGNGPDIYRYHNSWVGMMKPYLTPMSAEVISADDLKKNYFPVIQQDLIRNGALYGVPLGIDTLSLFVNTELFEAGGNSVPKTWDDFVRVAKDRVVKDDQGKIKTAGAAMGTYDNITHAPDIIALLMAQNGADFSDFSATKDNVNQALQFYTAFAEDEGSVWDSTLDPSITAFARGNVAMYFGYSWDIFTLKSLNPDLKFSIHPVPNLPGRQLTMASYWVEGISSKTKHQKEAQLFMQFLAKKETLQKLYSETAKTRLFGDLYPRSDLAATISSNPLIAPFLQQAPFATSSYFVSDTYDEGINEQMNAYLGNAIRGQDSGISLTTAVDALAQGVNQVLGKYGR